MSGEGRPLRVLMVEDSERDAALLTLNLRRGGFAADVVRVQTRAEMEQQLSERTFDVVLSDYVLPLFSAPDALTTLRRSGKDIPFIVISGVVGEDIAVGMMKTGAHDYVTKDKLTRLVPAIERELQDAHERNAKRRAETLFEAILRSSPDPAAVIDRGSLEIVDASESFARVSKNAQPGARLFDVLRLAHPERVEQLLRRGRGTAWYLVYEDGDQTRVANARVHTVDYQGVSYAYLVLEDVTEQHYLKAAFDAVPNAVLIISPQRTLLYANRVAEQLFEDLIPGADVTPFLDFPALGEAWWTRPTPRHEESRVTLKDKPYEAAAVTFRFAGHEGRSTILTLRSLEQEDELIQLATHDALTGIHNLRYFNECLEKRLAERSASTPMAFAIVDLDYFKPINDELGHAAGDAALIRFASLVRTELRESDVFARVGGDEFAILFGEESAREASALIARVYERMKTTPFVYESHTRTFSASIGLTHVRSTDTPASLKQRADEALYEAKRGGRGRMVVADTTGDRVAPGRPLDDRASVR
jgi:diguanylate cyclase (GGDEF)-like protein